MSTMMDRITNDMKAAMKAGDADRVSVLRMLRSELMNEAIAVGKKDEGLDDETAFGVLKRAAKQRSESAEEYDKAGRKEQAAAERAELAIIEEYLPEQLSDDAIRTTVEETITALGASGPSDMGRVMGAVMEKLQHRADGSTVRRFVEKALQSS